MTAEQRRGCDATQRPSAPILLSVCGTRTVSWNVLEQTKQVYYIHVHTHTRLDTNTYCPFKIKRQSEGKRKSFLQTVKRKKDETTDPCVPGVSRLLRPVLVTSLWYTSSFVSSHFSHWYRDSRPHNDFFRVLHVRGGWWLANDEEFVFVF